MDVVNIRKEGLMGRGGDVEKLIHSAKCINCYYTVQHCIIVLNLTMFSAKQ